MNETYLTLRLPFNACDAEARMLLSTARLFRHVVLHLHSLILGENPRITSLIALKKMYRRRLQEILPNRRYVDGAITLVYSIYESAQALGVPFNDIEFKNWLLFQQAEKEYPCRNVTLQRDYSFRITTISYQGESRRIPLKPTISRSYRRVLGKIIEERQPYVARVVLRGYGERGNVLWVHGEIHLSIPYKFYLEHFKRYRGNHGALYGGVDVNVDRANLAVVDRYGRLRDVRTFWFEEASWKGCPRQRAWSIIGMAIHDMLRYAYHHGVKVLFLENPETLGYLKTLWVRKGERRSNNYNYRVQVFRNRVVERIALKASLYSIGVKYVDPRGTTRSEEHDELMRRHGLDRHTASAYLIALRGMERYTTIQKATV
ncbi:MAG: hypothetical protein DRJ96_07325 [Thermoprotei archaeon]|nr:MAG: hypothetical protein DRJ67_10440 [Thermoprotei archaeon]RLE96146.1 MAG: hypothetical protein DRJ96_07325 [Thermoprotei archaeon]